MTKFLMVLLGGMLGFGVWAVANPARQAEPDPDLLRLAVRATVHAWPTPAPREIIVTQVVTQVVEVIRVVEVTPAPQTTAVEPATPEPPTPTPSPGATPLQPESRLYTEAIAAAAQAPEVPEQAGSAPSTTLAAAARGCPSHSERQYTSIPIEGGRADHPAHEHGDLNPALRGSAPATSHLGLVEISGPTDSDAPQLDGLFADRRLATFAGAYVVRDWNWGCGARGCRGEMLDYPEITQATLAAQPGEPIAAPYRHAQIYGGGFVALVLYADEHTITLSYTREDSVANGYAVHVQDFCVDPALLAAYRAANSGGRGSLPALRNGEILGVALGDTIRVSIRDRGMFKDPRSRKDWWAGH